MGHSGYLYCIKLVQKCPKNQHKAQIIPSSIQYGIYPYERQGRDGDARGMKRAGVNQTHTSIGNKMAKDLVHKKKQENKKREK